MKFYILTLTWIINLQAGAVYRIRIYCADQFFGAANARLFSILVDGISLYQDIDLAHDFGYEFIGMFEFEAYVNTLATLVKPIFLCDCTFVFFLFKSSFK